MNEIETVDSAENKSDGSKSIDAAPKISLEIFEIEKPIYLRGGDQNDPTKGVGDCDS